MMPGLRTDQAPPLAIPASFFLLTPLWMVVGAVILAVWPAALAARWSGPALALVHVGTLGVLASTMFGALYQLTPVVAGAPVPAVRLAHGVHAALTLGLGLLVARFLGAPAWMGVAALCLLGVAVLGFALPVGVALSRAPAPGWTPSGMRRSMLALALVVGLGLWSAMGHVGGAFPAARLVFTQVHLSLGLTAWLGGLVAAVGWQVVPMFYLAPPASVSVQRMVHGAQAIGMLLLAAVGVAAAAGLPVKPVHAIVAALPAALGVWGLAPAWAFSALRRRGRARADASIRFWFTAIPAAWSLIPLGAAASLADDPRWGICFAWVAIWGWAATLVHGMLTRILPFLVWFHNFAHDPASGPPMRASFPDHRVRVGHALHLGTTVAGLGGVVLGNGVLPAIGMGLTGVWLAGNLVETLRYPPNRPKTR